VKELRDIDAAYLAGLIDGEGYIGVTASKTSKSAKGCKRGIAYRCHVCVNMVEKAAIEFGYRVTGIGRIAPKKASRAECRPAWSWNMWSSEASDLCLRLLPFLLIKREQAENLIAFNSIMRLPGSKGLSDEEWKLRERYWLRSRELNKRGV